MASEEEEQLGKVQSEARPKSSQKLEECLEEGCRQEIPVPAVSYFRSV